jgi:hypothetical protein
MGKKLRLKDEVMNACNIRRAKSAAMRSHDYI